MIRNRESGKYMNVINASMEDWELMAQYAYHTDGHAKWNISMLTNGDYVFQACHSGKYLRVANTPTLVTNIAQFSDYSPPTTRWQIYSTSSGAFRIVPKENTAFALTLPNDGTQYNNGTCIIQNTYTNDTNYIDEWYIDDGYNEHKKIVSGAVYSIINKNSGKHVAINPSNLLDGSDVIQKAEVEAEGSMLWQINHIGNGEYKIMNLAAERLLSIDGSWSTEGADSQIWHDDGTTGQIFKIRENSDNTYSFLTKCSGFTKALTVSGASTAENTILEQTTYTGSTSQKFNLESNYVMLYICASEMNSSNIGADSNFGHSWIEITNLTNENIEFGHYTIYIGEHISVGLFGTDVTINGVKIPQKGIWYNRESYACHYEDKYLNYTRIGTLVSTINLRVASAYTRVISNENNDGQWDISEDYNGWLYNCVHFALEVWNESVAESYKLYTGMAYQTYTIALWYYFLQLNANSLIDTLTVSPTDLKDAIRMQFSSEYESVNCLFSANAVSYHNGTSLITYPIE